MSVQNVDASIQWVLKDIFREFLITPFMSVSEIEYALDFYPENQSDLDSLRRVIAAYAVMRHAQPGSCNQIASTHYQGLDGNVRKGSKGLTDYYREDEENDEEGKFIVRLEGRANRNFIRKRSITIDTMPIEPSIEDIFEFVDFRRGLTEESFWNLRRAIAKKRIVIDHDKSRARRRQMMRMRSMEGMVHKFIDRRKNPLDVGWSKATEEELEEPSTSLFDLDISKAKFVREQIQHFKVLKKKYGLTHSTDCFFPKFNDEFLGDIRSGFLRKSYSGASLR